MSYISRPQRKSTTTRLTVAKADFLANKLYQQCHIVGESKYTVILELNSSGLIKLCDELVKLNFQQIC